MVVGIVQCNRKLISFFFFFYKVLSLNSLFGSLKNKKENTRLAYYIIYNNLSKVERKFHERAVPPTNFTS